MKLTKNAPKGLCHCVDCRKISGSTYSTNLAVPEDSFKITSGTLKSISKTADGGNKITSYFCGDCGSTIYRDGATFAGLKVIKAGLMDGDILDTGSKPDVELYTSRRAGWVAEVDGAGQKVTMA
jgi:hypothetical protein